METIKQEIENLLYIQEQLKSDKLEQIDFDKLIVELGNVRNLYENYVGLTLEHNILRENLIEKVNIMEKAIHVVSKKRVNMKEVDATIQELRRLDSEQLIKAFHNSETKFHRAFPTTFQNIQIKKNKYKDYASCK